MKETINISTQDLFNHIKLSCQIPQLIEEIASYQVIELAAKEAGINVDAEELQQAANDFRIDNQLNNAEATWSWLYENHLTLDDFEALVYANALTNKLAEHLFADKVKLLFYAHQLDYSGAILYEILLEEEDLALELFCSLQEREISFHEVARQYIQDLSLRRAGGYLGKVLRKDLKPEISAAVFSATPPEILKPIKTSKGTHLILVEEIIQPKLDDEIRADIISDLFSGWINEKIQNLEVNAHFKDLVSI